MKKGIPVMKGDQIALRESFFMFTEFFGMKEEHFEDHKMCREQPEKDVFTSSCERGCHLVHRRDVLDFPRTFCGKEGYFQRLFDGLISK